MPNFGGPDGLILLHLLDVGLFVGIMVFGCLILQSNWGLLVL